MRALAITLVALGACDPAPAKVDKDGRDSAATGATGLATGVATGVATGAATGSATGPATGAGTGTGTTDTGTATGTAGGTTVPATITAICDPTTNPIRFLCDIQVDPPQPVDVTFWISGTPTEYTLGSDAVAMDHEVLLYLMKENTTYEWRATPRVDTGVSATGDFTTGLLTGGCAVTATINGTTTAPYIVSQSPCITDANVIVVDQDGDVVWCDDFSPAIADPMIEGGTFTEDNTFLMVVADAVIEKDLAGNELLRLTRGVDFANHVHHDAFRKDGYTYVLFNETVSWNGSNYDLDGVYVFSGNVLLGEWHLFDVFQPAQAPIGWPGRDYSHANAVWVDDNDNMLVSFRHLSAVASVRADPLALDFGTVSWRIAGLGPTAEFGSDYRITSSIGVEANFERQHNVHFLPTGELVMFDNRDGIIEMSRLLQLTLDPVNGEADITGSYELPMHCDFQGGAMHTTGGNPIATCAPQRRAWEWDAGAATSRWDMTLACTAGVSSYIPRFIPWDGPFQP